MRFSLCGGFAALLLLFSGNIQADFLLVTDKSNPQVVFRVNTETGAAQTLAVKGSGVYRWELIDETERIDRAVEYRFAAFTQSGATRLVRIDPKSGKSWVTNGRTWRRALEP